MSATTTAPTMSLGRKIAFGAGDFGFNLYWQMASLYLLFFYTEVAGLPPAVAGTIYMAALVWDAALDPLIGAVADRTRTRWGRYRPYLLFGGFPLAIVFVIMLFQPIYDVSGQDVSAVWFAAVLHVGFRTVYAVIAIPYAALFARVTRDARLRADLAGFRMMAATLAAIFVAAGTQPLVKALATPEDPRHGWVILGIGFGIVSVLLFLLVAWAAKGYDDLQEEHVVSPPLAVSLRALLQNRALLMILGAVMISSMCSTLFGKNLLYYFKYIVGKEELGGTAMAITALTVALFVPVFTVLARTYGKRAAWLCGTLPSLCGLVLWHFAEGAGLTPLFVALGLFGIGSAAYAVCFWSMLPDTVEYGEWRSGVRTESLVFGLAILGQKLALGLGAGLLGILLEQVGYVANTVQTPETLDGIRNMMFWIPLAGGLISAAFIWFYPVTLQSHGKMVEEIAARQKA